jgi:hypothetical protein
MSPTSVPALFNELNDLIEVLIYMNIAQKCLQLLHYIPAVNAEQPDTEGSIAEILRPLNLRGDAES